MYKIFIDGHAGTTGLQIHQRLQGRSDIELLHISDADRKNADAKKQIIETADVVILCLPDQAAIESVQLARSAATSNNMPNKISNQISKTVRFIDASTAHRTHPDWVYGLPEMNPEQRSKIASARLVSNPGCYPTGFLLPVMPLVERGLLNSSALITISALSGYSGGGRSMMEKYQQKAGEDPAELWHARPYALHLAHKHIPEMKHFARLDHSPLFLPSVGHFAQGMLVSAGLFRGFFNDTPGPQEIFDIIASAYENEACINVYGPNDESQLVDGFLDPQANNETNSLDIFIFGNDEQILLISRLDNLGKGAAGAAVQNLNLMLGTAELEGLTIREPFREPFREPIQKPFR
jgi:N-acetyl-gamma-glutamyl-phosphate reductase